MHAVEAKEEAAGEKFEGSAAPAESAEAARRGSADVAAEEASIEPEVAPALPGDEFAAEKPREEAPADLLPKNGDAVLAGHGEAAPKENEPDEPRRGFFSEMFGRAGDY
ncbi:hypothetical protein BH20VER1_BH20VER1_29660 [soil metagenome]